MIASHLQRLAANGVGQKIGAQHHRVAVGKNNDIKYAEKYGESHGDQCVHHTQHKAIDDELNEK